MSQHSHDPKPEFPFARSARARAAQRLIPAGAALAGIALLALASCGPDTGAGPEASSAPSATPNAAAASRASLAETRSSAPTASAAAAAAPACPKVAPIHCPAAPNTAVQGAPTHLAAATATHANPLATGWSRASRRSWSRHHGMRHGEAYAGRARRQHRWESDQMQGERQDRFVSAGSYESRQVTRSESTQVYGDERFAERGREVFRSETYACPRACPGHRTFDYAGIDSRGYLVWPGKVEY